jgi:hypothetical protein
MNMGALNVNWRGGKMTSQGYVRLLVDVAGKRTYLYAHRLVMEEALGRPLRSDEGVHHINGDRADNRLANLQLRQGAHGNGAAFCCADCGSANVVAVPLQESEVVS